VTSINTLDLVRYDPAQNCFVLKGHMKHTKCKCHSDSPFHWRENPRPSIFLQDVMFRAKGAVASTDYKAFGIYSRATPQIKPYLNKHEL
jgi:hypothetical protein